MITYVTVWAGILAAFSVAAAIFWLRWKVRRISREAFGTPDIVAGFKKQELILEQTPKSISAMTGMELPRIQRDFPEFSWPQWRQQCETMLGHYLVTLEKRDLSCLAEASPMLRDRVAGTLDDLERQGVREQFRNLLIHRTEIHRYEKQPGICRILIQSAVEYRHSCSALRADGVLTDHREQHRYVFELVYIQDPDKVADAAAVAVNCPNCGAPLASLGAHRCPYCGAAAEPVNLRAWHLQNICMDV